MWLQLFVLGVICRWKGYHRKCWGGWTTDAFRGAISVFKKSPDFLLRNPDFLIRNLDFLLKNVDFLIKTDLGPMTRLGFHGLLALIGEWWSWEIASGMTATLGEVQLAAFAVISNFSYFYFVLPFG